MIWEFQRALNMPRVAAIAHPFGRPYGDVGNRDTQSAVLKAALSVFNSAKAAGHVEHLDFEWHEDPKRTRWHPPKPAPIIEHMRKTGAL